MNSSSRHILIGMTASIAAYKVCSLVSALTKAGHEVRVIMTAHAAQFVAPLTLAALSHNDVLTDEFDGMHEAMIPHIELARWADVFLIAPADANILGKAACGIADDLLSSAILAATCPILAAPAMNVHMYENAAVQNNLRVLKERGWTIVDPAEGMLACQESGKGRLADPDDLQQAILSALKTEKQSGQLEGVHVLVSAGPTQEALDPVRFLSNHSSGKQGYAIAAAAAKAGAAVRLVSGPVSLQTPPGVERIDVTTAREMQQAMEENAAWADFIIMAAAVADYRFACSFDHKLKKGEDSMSVEFVRNPDILAGLGKNKRDSQVLCGFAMETENLDANAEQKMKSKNCDLLIANNLTTEGAGFQGDTNVVTLMTPSGREHLPLQTKEELGRRILKTMRALWKGNDPHASVH